ncbi:MAG: RsmE family RNA methyltransferase [Acidobacteriota bacterium]
MPPPRFIVERLPASGERVRLPAEEEVHARSRRLASGDEVLLIDGTGARAEGRIAEAARGEFHINVTGIRPADDPGPAIRLAVAGVRPERMSWTAEKAAELGVSRLTLVRTDRTQSFRAGPSALARLERLVREAAKQSGADRWPLCEGPVDLAEALDAADGVRLFLDASGEAFPPSLEGPVSLLVGPEGGWSEAERASASRAGWRAVALPAATLRAETAAVAAVVLTRAALAREPSKEDGASGAAGH